MAGTYDATVNAFYLAYYGRPADPAGLAYWSQALTQSGGDFSTIVNAFSTSAEATAHFSNDSATDHISAIYQQLFGRAPDQAGLDYWTAAIGSGSVSLADAAIQIMSGAQSSDAQVSALRQDAAAQFTASVAASGVAYDGTAAVEAARVLIAAVTTTSSADDIKALVTASASLVQTAHDNPAIITALASSGDLTALLSTTSGKSDPVALVQALASIGKAAVSDSAGLATLLKGGGIAGLISSLPAGTTLQDVTKAVDAGGLAAGTVVATPVVTPVDTTPVITPKIAFVGVDGHDLPTSTTLVANSIWYFIDIQGKPAKATTIFEVSKTGAGDWKATDEDTTLADGTYYVRYTVKDAAGNSGTSNTLKLVMDHTLASPTVQLSHDTGFANDGLTNNGEVTVSGLRANETWTYSFDGRTWTTGTADANGVGTIADTRADGVHNLTVRTLETVKDGTGFTSTALSYTVDTKVAAPVIALVNDTGASNSDHVTSDGTIKVTGLEAGATWQYSLDNGAHWYTGGSADQQGASTLQLYGQGLQTALVHSTDAAGNVSADTTFNFTLDKYLSVLLNVSGHYGSDITVNSAGLVFQTTVYGDSQGLKTTYEVSATGNADDFHVWTPGQQQLDDGTYYFRANALDLAGNTTTTNALTVHIDNTAPAIPTVALDYDTGVQGDSITADGQFIVSGLEANASFDYSLDNGATWVAGPIANADGKAYGFAAAGEQTIVVRAHDAAGNVSAASDSLHFTYDPHPVLAGLNFDHIVGEATGAVETSQTSVDVVFTYTGAIMPGDTFEYQVGNTSTAFSADTDNQAITVDTAAHTITLHNIDLSSSNPYVGISGTDVAGSITQNGQYISGPYSYFWTNETAVGLDVVGAVSGKHVYLTDGDNTVQIGNINSYQDAVVGVQTSVVKGTLGVGTSAATQTSHDGSVCALGTDRSDTIAASHIWGFGGDDTITAVGDAYGSSVISGGAGADVIHTEGVTSFLSYGAASESAIVTDTDAVTTAHGFDTVYVSQSLQSGEYFNFEGLKLTNVASLVVADHNTSFNADVSGSTLLQLINTAVGDAFEAHAGKQQAALIDFGHSADGEVNFLVVDANGDGKIGADDYVVKLVGSVTLDGLSGDAQIYLNVAPVA